jgi:hypothetical protein
MAAYRTAAADSPGMRELQEEEAEGEHYNPCIPIDYVLQLPTYASRTVFLMISSIAKSVS